jgi:hypothetical protein
VSAPVEIDLNVICTACRFLYPSVRGFCPLCGTIAPQDEGIAFSPESSARPKRELKMVFAVLALLICGSLAMARYYKILNIPNRAIPRRSSTEIQQAAVAPTVPTEQVSPVRSDTATNSEARSETKVQDGPAELWKKVQSGSENAEVELAKLYLDGRGVAQNCEQAHLLLLAASKKRSNAASNLLSGDYVRRCE